MSVDGVQDDPVQAIESGSAKEGPSGIASSHASHAFVSVASSPLPHGNGNPRIVEVPVGIEGRDHESPPIIGRLRLLEVLRWEEVGLEYQPRRLPVP